MHRASHMWRAVNAEKFRRQVSHKECRKAAWRRGPTDSLSYFCDQTLPLLWRATQPPNQKSAPTPCPQGQLRNRTPATVGSPPPGARQGPHMTALPHQGQDGRGLATRRPQASTDTLEQAAGARGRLPGPSEEPGEGACVALSPPSPAGRKRSGHMALLETLFARRLTCLCP